MKKHGTHLPKASPAHLPKTLALVTIATDVRARRVKNRWSQGEMVNVIRAAEGKKPLKPTKGGWIPNGRVSRVERGLPTTLSNLTGFALAFGYPSAIEWLRDVFAGHKLTRQEAELLAIFRKLEAYPEKATSVVKMAQATVATLPSDPAAAADSPARARGRHRRGDRRSKS